MGHISEISQLIEDNFHKCATLIIPKHGNNVHAFVCNFCEDVFLEFSELMEHLQTELHLKELSSDVCGMEERLQQENINDEQKSDLCKRMHEQHYKITSFDSSLIELSSIENIANFDDGEINIYSETDFSTTTMKLIPTETLERSKTDNFSSDDILFALKEFDEKRSIAAYSIKSEEETYVAGDTNSFNEEFNTASESYTNNTTVEIKNNWFSAIDDTEIAMDEYDIEFEERNYMKIDEIPKKESRHYVVSDYDIKSTLPGNDLELNTENSTDIIAALKEFDIELEKVKDEKPEDAKSIDTSLDISSYIETLLKHSNSTKLLPLAEDKQISEQTFIDVEEILTDFITEKEQVSLNKENENNLFDNANTIIGRSTENHTIPQQGTALVINPHNTKVSVEPNKSITKKVIQQMKMSSKFAQTIKDTDKLATVNSSKRKREQMTVNSNTKKRKDATKMVQTKKQIKRNETIKNAEVFVKNLNVKTETPIIEHPSDEIAKTAEINVLEEPLNKPNFIIQNITEKIFTKNTKGSGMASIDLLQHQTTNDDSKVFDANVNALQKTVEKRELLKRVDNIKQRISQTLTENPNCKENNINMMKNVEITEMRILPKIDIQSMVLSPFNNFKKPFSVPVFKKERGNILQENNIKNIVETSEIVPIETIRKKSTEPKDNCLDATKLDLSESVFQYLQHEVQTDDIDLSSIFEDTQNKFANEMLVHEDTIGTGVTHTKNHQFIVRQQDDRNFVVSTTTTTNETVGNGSNMLNNISIQIINADDCSLLETVGLLVIAQPEYEDSLLLSDNKKAVVHGKASRFAKLFMNFPYIWQSKSNDPSSEQNLKSIFTNLTKLTNEEFTVNLTIVNLKRIVNIILAWYTNIRKLSAKREIPTQFIYYIDQFSFMPKRMRRKFFCEICDAQLNTQIQLNSHNIDHGVMAAFSCTVCLRRYKTINGLEKHVCSKKKEQPKMKV